MKNRLRRVARPAPPTAQKLKVLWITPELDPLLRSSALAVLAAQLPGALRGLEVEPLVVAPRAPGVDPLRLAMAKRLTVLSLPRCQEAPTAELWEWKAPSGVRVFFLEHPLFAHGRDPQDGPMRSYLLSAGALALAKSLGFAPDIVHCLGWPAALAPRLLQRAKDPFFAHTKTVLSLHDMRDQGVFPKRWVETLDLGWDGFHLGGFEFYDQISFLKAGVAFADQLVALTPRYADEVQTPEGGAGLDGLVRYRAGTLCGLPFGLDYESFDPRTDHELAQPFSAQDFFGRRRCKAALQRLCKLPIRENRPLLALLGDASPASGLDRVLPRLDAIVSTGCQLAVVLRGPDRSLDEAFLRAAREHPDQIGVLHDPNPGHERRALAGADLVLLPQRFAAGDPAALKALRYGAVPIASEVAGLADLVEESPSGTGFRFSSREDGSILPALARALSAYGDNRSFRQLQLRGMLRDDSWHAAARSYRDLFFSLAGRPLPKPPVEENAPLVESVRPRISS